MSLIAPVVDVQLKSVLMATDFTPASDTPLRHAHAIARHYGAKIYLAYVVSSLGFTLVGPDAVVAATEAACRDLCQLENHLVRIGALAGLRHEIVVRQGEVWRELARVIKQEQIDLLVIGTHARRGLSKLVLGSVAEQVFRQADCQVLTVGPRSFPEAHVEGSEAPRTVLFATDFGEASRHALPYALSLADHFQARLVCLQVLPGIPAPEGIGRRTAGDRTEQQASACAAALRRLEELVPQTAGAGMKPEFQVMFGPPSERILQAAESLKADAIILGLHASTHVDAAAHLPGATAYHVVCNATCPVLTVRKSATLSHAA